MLLMGLLSQFSADHLECFATGPFDKVLHQSENLPIADQFEYRSVRDP